MSERHCKTWSESEELYLENNVGKIKIETMANTLGRTVAAVRQKMYKRKLKSCESTVDIVLHHFSKMTGIFISTLYWWVNNKELPAKKKYISNDMYLLVISVEDWWNWAEQNKKLIDFNKYEFWTLGELPEWVNKQKAVDKNNIAKQNKNKKMWTKEENIKLKNLCKLYRYTSSEIAKELGRTESAVNMQIYRLGIKEWPLKSKPVAWTDEEKNTVKDLLKKGYGSVAIAEKLGRSQQSIRREYYKARDELRRQEMLN